MTEGQLWTGAQLWTRARPGTGAQEPQLAHPATVHEGSPSRATSAGVSASAKLAAVTPGGQQASSAQLIPGRLKSAFIERSPAWASRCAAWRSSADQRAHSGWGCPPTTGTTE